MRRPGEPDLARPIVDWLLCDDETLASLSPEDIRGVLLSALEQLGQQGREGGVDAAQVATATEASTSAALREVRARLRLAMDAAAEGTWEWNLVTGRVYFDRTAFAMLGYEPDEVAQSGAWWIDQIHPDERSSAAQAFDDYIAGKAPGYSQEFRLRRKDGEYIWVTSHGSVIRRDGDGTPTLAVGIHRDVTGRKQAEMALREANARLASTVKALQTTQEKLIQRERMAAVGQLAAGIAHDFNNVLASIVLYAQLCQGETVPGTQVHRRLKLMVEEAQRGAFLVQQILDFGGRAMLQRRTVEVMPFVEDVAHLLRRTLPSTVEVLLEPDDACAAVQVHGDAARLEQALLNLGCNARDAMPDGGRLTLLLCCTPPDTEVACAICREPVLGEWVVIGVQDEGCGIPAAARPHIFEPFFTTRAPLGHGLGLPQVMGIVRQHRGHVAMETAEGVGTVMKLYLPVLRASS